MATTQEPVRAAPGGPEARSGLDTRMLALASLASVLGGVVASAFGGGPLATLICAAISPWVTAFLVHPGPHRVRRVTAVLLFALLVSGCRKAFAAVRTAVRVPGRQARRRGRDAGGKHADAGGRAVGPGEARRARAWLGQVTLTAAIALPVAVMALTTTELIRGEAFAADRDTTFFGGHPAPSGPAVLVPDEVVARAGDDDATRVTYRVTAADADGDPLVPACDPRSGALFALGRTRVTCSATDAAGDRAQAGFVVTVEPGGSPQPPDDAQPALTLPEDFTHDATATTGARVTYAASARDVRDGPLTPDCRPVSGSLFALGDTRVICTAIDGAGNTARGSFQVTVVRAGDADRTPPVMTVPDALEIPATGRGGATVAYDVSATDNRDGALKPSCTPPSGSVFVLGATTVRCSARDSAENEATKSFTVIVTRAEAADRTPPRIATPRRVRARATSAEGAIVRFRSSAVDNRDGAVKSSCDPRSGSVFAVGATTVICEAQDSAGNHATKSFEVTVLAARRPPPTSGSGDRPPVITVPDPIRTPATSRDGATVSYEVTAIDDRSRALRTICAPRSGSVFGFGRTTVNCYAQDSAGNKATRSFTVTVVDGTAPVITVPDTIEEFAANPEGRTVIYEPSATDDRDGTVTPSCTPASGSVFPVGTTTVRCSAQDSAGNTAARNFAVIVRYGSG